MRQLQEHRVRDHCQGHRLAIVEFDLRPHLIQLENKIQKNGSFCSFTLQGVVENAKVSKT
jgi:hypothetical protein